MTLDPQPSRSLYTQSSKLKILLHQRLNKWKAIGTRDEAPCEQPQEGLWNEETQLADETLGSYFALQVRI